MFPLYLGLALLVLAVILHLVAGAQRRRSGLPSGKVIYSDTRGWRALEKPLYDPGLALTGKPDYLVEQAGEIIPVEVKTGHTPSAPYPSHVLQLAAYCLLVERCLQKRPSHGILHYPQRDFAVEYNEALESTLLATLGAMRQDEHRSSLPRSHQETQRCEGCGFAEVCDQKLA